VASMREVESAHIHASIDQVGEHLHAHGLRSNGAHDLGLHIGGLWDI
jgi:hypothetical protein